MNYFYLIPDLKYENAHAIHRIEKNWEYLTELTQKMMELGGYPFNFIEAHKALTKAKT